MQADGAADPDRPPHVTHAMSCDASCGPLKSDLLMFYTDGIFRTQDRTLLRDSLEGARLALHAAREPEVVHKR